MESNLARPQPFDLETEFVTYDRHRILIRSDGHIATIGATRISEYAGEPTREICQSVAPRQA
jgi:hypothetical protein